jgi:UDP-N-acetylglucosamine diphosphorylase / glucose-1-phosphate thymidylyltransferase / UDP-N-acetylgalactosamine diphosphorylase / glucosamine-1-phosphate N-acetyltransferase / galactosamine-1-phosphate N-acetyltransferase
LKPLDIYIFDDAVARAWEPFALTRPAGALLLGAFTSRARAEQLFGGRCAGYIAAPHLAGFAEPDAPSVVAADRLDTDRSRLFLSSRAIVDWTARFDAPAGPAAIRVAGEIAGWYSPAGVPAPEPDWFRAPEAGTAAEVELGGRVLANVWDLIGGNTGQLTVDIEALDADAEAVAAAEQVVRAGEAHVLGYRRGLLRIGAGVRIEPHVVLDCTDGPIWLDDGVVVRAFTRLAGPAYVGRNTTLLGGPFSGVSIGRQCKVHGEVEESVIHGYSNKAHEGFLGHAYLGRWVNLGAMTTNSDLKNNYGTIRIWTPAGEADTGLMKLGCLLGDHVKTGIGALLNTGTVIGAGSNLFGTDMPPKFVPPFSWGSGEELVAFDIDKFLEVAETVMQRRDVTLGDGMRNLLRGAWRIGREQA